MSALLEARSLHLSFGTTRVLRGIDFTLNAGESVSLMGPSGCGKSTLLHVLAGILVPDRGEVTFAGVNLSNASDNHRSRRRLEEMGFVFQFGDLVPELTMLENVALPLQLLGVGARDATFRAHEQLARLDVADVARAVLSEVSGGQAQRVAVARALVHEPRVIFADEPTGALDSIAGEQVMNALISAVQDSGAAAVIVTHDARVASYADANVSMRDGALVGEPQ